MEYDVRNNIGLSTVPINTNEKPNIIKAGIPVYLLPNLSIIKPAIGNISESTAKLNVVIYPI